MMNDGVGVFAKSDSIEINGGSLAKAHLHVYIYIYICVYVRVIAFYVYSYECGDV